MKDACQSPCHCAVTLTSTADRSIPRHSLGIVCVCVCLSKSLHVSGPVRFAHTKHSSRKRKWQHVTLMTSRESGIWVREPLGSFAVMSTIDTLNLCAPKKPNMAEDKRIWFLEELQQLFEVKLGLCSYGRRGKKPWQMLSPLFSVCFKMNVIFVWVTKQQRLDAERNQKNMSFYL